MFCLSFRERKVLICLSMIILASAGFKFIKKEKAIEKCYGNITRRHPTEEAHGGLIEINKAGLQELRELPGIGPVLALRIKEFIETEGAIKDSRDLQKIKGIGQKKAEDISKYIVF